jgi:predicted permease
VAVRGLTRRPGFSLVVILTLGLGMGANVAVFSVLHSVVFAPLPYERGDELVRLYATRVDIPEGNQRLSLSAPMALELRDQVQSLAGVAIMETSAAGGADLTGGTGPERVRLLPVNADYFDVMGWGTVVGRGFTHAEESAEAQVAVVREDVWRRHLGGDPAAIGGTLTLDGRAVTVVGVVSDAARDPLEGRVDVWIPTELGSSVAQNWDNNYLSVVARLGPDADVARVTAELALVSERHATISSRAAEKGFAVVPLRDDLVGDARPMLSAVMGAVGFLLLLTCVNVASLLMARAADRERELAIRASLGSPRARLLRALTLEAGILAVAGGAAGILIGLGALDAVMAVAPADLPMREGVLFGTPAVLAAGATSVVVGLVLGLATTLSVAKAGTVRLVHTVRTGDDRTRVRARSVLVAVEVALAVVLLTGATALLRSVDRLRSQDLGTDPEGVLTFTVGLPDARYGSDAALYDFSLRFHQAAAAIPGVRSVGATSRLPATGSYNTWGTRRAFAPGAPFDTDNTQVNQRWVAGDIFQTLGLDLLEGRDFAPGLGPDDPYEVVVNRTLVRRLFGDDEPLGAWLTFGGRYGQVVGVVEDEALTPRSPPEPVAYHPQRQWISGNRQMTQVVRTDGDAVALVPALREALGTIDPELILFQPTLLGDVIGAGMAQEAFASRLLAAFAVLAVVIAGLGLYGLLAYEVRGRRHEIGVRIALGADAVGVLGLVVRRGISLSMAGAAFGVLLAYVLGDTLRALLYGVDPHDPWLLATAPLVLLVVAVVSSFLPARRATRVDPLASLRSD